MNAPRAWAIKREEADVILEVLIAALHQLDEIDRAVKHHPAGYPRRCTRHGPRCPMSEGRVSGQTLQAKATLTWAGMRWEDPPAKEDRTSMPGRPTEASKRRAASWGYGTRRREPRTRARPPAVRASLLHASTPTSAQAPSTIGAE